MNEIKTVAELRQTTADLEKAIQSQLDTFAEATGYKVWIAQHTKDVWEGTKLVRTEDYVQATLRAKL